MYKTPNGQINDNDPYTGADGTQYPGNFPKTEIAELSPITAVPQPAFDPLTQAVNQLPEVQVNGIWTQQWAVTALDASIIKARGNAQVDNDLAALDLKTIRSLREWAATQPTATQFIKDHALAAVALRGKLK